MNIVNPRDVLFRQFWLQIITFELGLRFPNKVAKTFKFRGLTWGEDGRVYTKTSILQSNVNYFVSWIKNKQNIDYLGIWNAQAELKAL